jgi:hypothetical protein
MTEIPQHAWNTAQDQGNREVILENERLPLILLLMIIPFYFLGDRVFHLIWNHRDAVFNPWLPWWIKGLSVAAGIVVHEALHGLVFALYAPGGFRSVSFGFNARLGAFYCHCSDPLPVRHYRRAGITPFVALGLLPLFASFLTGMVWMKTFGLLLSIGGFGDLLVWLRLLRYPAALRILDHPEKLGFIITGEASSGGGK